MGSESFPGSTMMMVICPSKTWIDLPSVVEAKPWHNNAYITVISSLAGGWPTICFSHRGFVAAAARMMRPKVNTDTQLPIYATLNHISSQGLETTEIVYDRKVHTIHITFCHRNGEPTAVCFRQREGNSSAPGFGLGSAVPIAQITRSSWLASWNCQRASSCSQAETYIDISLNWTASVSLVLHRKRRPHPPSQEHTPRRGR